MALLTTSRALARSYRSFFQITVLLLNLCILCSCRELRWTAEGDGSLQDGSNWNTGDAPAADDDLIIALPPPPASTSSRHLFTTSALLTHAFDPSSLDALPDPPTSLSLTAPLVARSLQLTGAGTLVVDGALAVDGRVAIGSEAVLRVRGGALVAASIECDGVLALELGSLSSTSTAAASASSSGTLRLGRDALFLLSGPGGSNHIQHYTVELHGGMVTLNAPVLLQQATIHIQPTGALVFHSELLSTEGEDTTSHIDNEGTMLVTGDEKQSLLLPLTNTGNVTLLSSSSLSIRAPMHSDGSITLKNRHRMLTAASVELSSSATLTLLDSSAVHIHSNRFINRGTISSGPLAADSQLVVSSMLNCSEGGQLDVRRVVLHDGSVWGLASQSRTSVRRLEWSGGQIAGVGRVSVLDGRLTGSAGGQGEAAGAHCASAVPKIVDGIELTVSGHWLHETCAVLMLRGGAQLVVKERGEYSMWPGTTMHCDTEDSQLHVLGRLTVEAALQQGSITQIDGDNEPLVVSIDVPLISEGNFTLRGTSTTVLHRSGSIAHIASESSPTLIIQPTTPTILFTFHRPLQLASSPTSRLVLQTAHNVALLATQPSNIGTLEVRDGRLQLGGGGVDVAELRLGTTVGEGVVEGGGVVNAGRVVMIAGSMHLDVLRVSGGIDVRHSAAKHLNVRNLTLMSNSVSFIRPSLLSLSSNSTIVLQSGAALTMSPSAILYTANATTEGGGRHTAQLFNGGSLVCAGSGHGATSLLVDVIHSGTLNISNAAAAGQYSVHLSGWSGALSSSIDVGVASLLALECPAGYGGGVCRYGRLGGGGAVSVISGSHVFESTLSLHTLLIRGGSARFLSWLTLDHAQVSQGELVLHSSLNTSTLQWSGGTIRGYPLLSSAVTLLPGGSASLVSNSTLTLDGAALLLQCPLHWKSGDFMLRNEALVRVEDDGSLLVTADDKRGVTMISDGSSSRIENAGTLMIHTPFTVNVPLANSGKLELLNGTYLSLNADYVQTGMQSTLHVLEGSQLTKAGGDLMVAQGSVSIRSGAVHGNVEVGGELLVGESSTKAVLDGDLILSPSASIHLLCRPADCRPLIINGTVYANGRLAAEQRSTDASYHVLNAIDVQNAFMTQPQQRITTADGKVRLHSAALSQPSNTTEPPSLQLSTLYLPFLLALPSTSSIQQSSLSASCAAQLQEAQQADSVLGLSRRSATALMVVLICLTCALASVVMGVVWWWFGWKGGQEGRRERLRSDSSAVDELVTVNGAEEDVPVQRMAGDVGVNQQQARSNEEVHYM